ncbi:hypothetical protein BDV30DRAFT_232194 [Aspergillus minisclerotigenes]|uniref:Uncharacterized protein n=1 Tax=Aspergillus minisclerotigenes TaxID=656917 RepID=A0A5N6ILJ2_9EURO|nr:hypothetical protein BDV30DRAFT_232194 [Aspergillus minisclerotigenes]
MSINGDPYLCCVLCGIESSLYIGDELRKAHEDWGAWAERKFNKRKSLIVPAAELEQLDLETAPPMWSCFYRAILDDPKIGRLSISGISPHLVVDRKKHRVLIDADNALVFPGPKMTYQRWNIGFQKGLHIGYVMHPHCWLLVDRFLGHGVVKHGKPLGQGARLRSIVANVPVERRCNHSLVLEAQDVYFCLGLHERLLQEDWY